jgi:TRAP-type C4-dicarboxylate transport system substrate-binding protein
MGHYTKAPYIVNDEHVRIPEMIIINKSVLESLSQEDQEIIRTAAGKSSLRQRQLWNEQEENNRKTLEKAGAVITEVENKEEFIESVQPVYQKYGESYEDIVAQIREMKD